MNIDSIYSNISRRIAAPRIHRLVISAIIGVLSGLIIPEEATAQPTIEHPSQSDSISSLKDSYHLPKLTRPPVAAEQQLHKKDLQAATWTKIMVAPGKSKTIPIKEVFFDSPICTIIRDSDDIEPVWVTHEPSTTRFLKYSGSTFPPPLIWEIHISSSFINATQKPQITLSLLRLRSPISIKIQPTLHTTKQVQSPTEQKLPPIMTTATCSGCFSPLFPS